MKWILMKFIEKSTNFKSLVLAKTPPAETKMYKDTSKCKELPTFKDKKQTESYSAENTGYCF